MDIKKLALFKTCVFFGFRYFSNMTFCKRYVKYFQYLPHKENSNEIMNAFELSVEKVIYNRGGRIKAFVIFQEAQSSIYSFSWMALFLY